jgi:hypothetical protein
MQAQAAASAFAPHEATKTFAAPRTHWQASVEQPRERFDAALVDAIMATPARESESEMLEVAKEQDVDRTTMEYAWEAFDFTRGLRLAAV